MGSAMVDVDEFKKYLAINKADLDEELIRQPTLFHEVSEAYTLAASERDAIKEDMAVIDAELDAEVRGKFEKAGNKYTEAMVKNEVQSHALHRQAFEVHAKAKLLADKLQALKDSFHQRRYMLQELCTLYATGYFESTSGGSANARDAKYGIQRTKLAEKRQRVRMETEE